MKREITRKELYDRVWSQPMKAVATEVGISDTRPWLDLGFWDVRHLLGKKAAARQNQVAYCELVDGLAPAFVTHLSTGPGPVLFDHVAVRYGVENPHSLAQ
jgi:hypothetical protein